MVGINCATMGTQYACIETCIANTPCAQLGVGTLQTCQGQCNVPDGGPPPGDAGQAVDAGPSGAQCLQCNTMSCGQQGLACFQDMTCQKWLGCIQMTCMYGDEACYEMCDAMYSAAENLYTPIYACSCSKCAGQCTALNPCAHGLDGGP
jgi:hypothetical protein